MLNTTLKVIFITGITLLFSACAPKNPIIESSFDVNNEFEVSSLFTNSSQIKSMAVNGLSPITKAGEVYFLHPSRGAQSSILIDMSKEWLGKEDFRIQKIVYENNATFDELLTIKSSLLKLEVLANYILDKTVDFYNKSSLEKNEEKKAIYKEELKLLNTQLTALKKEYNDNSTNLINLMKKKDIFIFKWNTNKDNSSSAKVSSLAEGKYKNSESKNGYVISTGVEVEKLVPSLSYLDAFECNINTDSRTSWHFGRAGVVSYLLKVKKLISFSSKENERLAKLEVNISNINKFSKELREIAKIDLNLSSLKQSLLSSNSQFSKAIITTSKPMKYKDLLDEKSEGISLFSIITEGFNIRKNFYPFGKDCKKNAKNK